jgi:NAD(P)-dependent dehydrogenase (short-subunit alcohol dehydrogenase family)
VVTGAGRGIGQEYALALAADGATVLVADLDDGLRAETVKLISSAGGSAVARQVDVGESRSTAEFGVWVRKEFGAAHILINNAAIYHSMRRDSQMEVDTVNAIAPGLIHTEATMVTVPAVSRAALLAQQALKKEGQPSDLAAALRFFCSDEAGWVSGQVTIVDGFKTLRI